MLLVNLVLSGIHLLLVKEELLESLGVLLVLVGDLLNLRLVLGFLIGFFLGLFVFFFHFLFLVSYYLIKPFLLLVFLGLF